MFAARYSFVLLGALAALGASSLASCRQPPCEGAQGPGAGEKLDFDEAKLLADFEVDRTGTLVWDEALEMDPERVAITVRPDPDTLEAFRCPDLWAYLSGTIVLASEAGPKVSFDVKRKAGPSVHTAGRPIELQGDVFFGQVEFYGIQQDAVEREFPAAVYELAQRDKLAFSMLIARDAAPQVVWLTPDDAPRPIVGIIELD